MKRRKHTFRLAVTFDKPCTLTHAAREARDCIHGKFYPTQKGDGDPGEMVVTSITRLGSLRLTTAKKPGERP